MSDKTEKTVSDEDVEEIEDIINGINEGLKHLFQSVDPDGDFGYVFTMVKLNTYHAGHLSNLPIKDAIDLLDATLKASKAQQQQLTEDPDAGKIILPH